MYVCAVQENSYNNKLSVLLYATDYLLYLGNKTFEFQN